MALKWIRIRKHAPSLILAAIVGYQLFVPPSIGLANNGDFGKIIGIFGLGAPSEDEYGYIDLKYWFEPRYHYTSNFYSSEALLVPVAIGLNDIFSKDGSFDLRWMGLIHGSLFILVIYLLEGLLADVGRYRGLLWWAVIVVFFGDVMYVSYFNSFYMDTAAYLFLMLSVVLFLRAAAWRRNSDAIGLVICVALLLLSKSQHAILALWIAPLFAFFGAGLWPGKGRSFAIVSAAIVAGAALLSVKAAPFDYGAHGYYSVIFSQVLPHSKNVKADLDALGLDDSYEKMIGTHAYSAESGMNDPAFVRAFMGRTSYARVGWYFLTHPRDGYLALRMSLEQGGRQRPPMGNFDRSAGLPRSKESQAIAFWSNAKRALFDGRGVRYLNCFMAIAVLMCAVATFRRRTLPNVLIAGVYALAGMGITEMLVAALADAVDVTRHYFIAATIFDLELLILCVLLSSGTVNPAGWRFTLNHRLHAETPQQQEL
jgi:hypothetical protein